MIIILPEFNRHILILTARVKLGPTAIRLQDTAAMLLLKLSVTKLSLITIYLPGTSIFESN